MSSFKVTLAAGFVCVVAIVALSVHLWTWTIYDRLPFRVFSEKPATHYFEDCLVSLSMPDVPVESRWDYFGSFRQQFDVFRSGILKLPLWGTVPSDDERRLVMLLNRDCEDRAELAAFFIDLYRFQVPDGPAVMIESVRVPLEESGVDRRWQGWLDSLPAGN